MYLAWPIPLGGHPRIGFVLRHCRHGPCQLDVSDITCSIPWVVFRFYWKVSESEYRSVCTANLIVWSSILSTKCMQVLHFLCLRCFCQTIKYLPSIYKAVFVWEIAFIAGTTSFITDTHYSCGSLLFAVVKTCIRCDLPVIRHSGRWHALNTSCCSIEACWKHHWSPHIQCLRQR